MRGSARRTVCDVRHLNVNNALTLGVDFRNIRVHMDLLRETNEKTPCLRGKLIARLEEHMENVETPSPSTMNNAAGVDITSNLDYSWQLFDQAIMEQVMDPFWMRPNHM